MKCLIKHICFSLILLALISCEPARLRRDSNINDTTSSEALTDGDSFISQGASMDEGAGFSHCSNAPMASATYIGAVQVCKNLYDANHLKVMINNADGGKKTCVITTYTDSSGNVIPLRDEQSTAQSCFFHKAGEIKVGKLVSNHPRFPHTAPNSVTIVKWDQMSGFYGCINAPDNFLRNPENCCSNHLGIAISPSCGGRAYTQNECYTAAYRYRDTVCLQYKNAFKNKYYLTYPL